MNSNYLKISEAVQKTKEKIIATKPRNTFWKAIKKVLEGFVNYDETTLTMLSKRTSGCAVDIRCVGKEQMIRYASILLDIADGTKQDFDELILEQHGSVCWLHFAVRPKDNRRRIEFLKV